MTPEETGPIILTLTFLQRKAAKAASQCEALFDCFLTQICRAGANTSENESSKRRPITASLEVRKKLLPTIQNFFTRSGRTETRVINYPSQSSLNFSIKLSMRAQRFLPFKKDDSSLVSQHSHLLRNNIIRRQDLFF